MATKTAKETKVTAAKAKTNADKKETVSSEDLFIVLDGEKHQLSSQISSIYACKEYFWKGKFTKGQNVKFVRGNGNEVPVHHASNCGYTLIGKAQNFFTSKKSLCANGESCDDQTYIYINENSSLVYSGKDGNHTIFLRIYDNINNNNNDRWVVIYID